MKKVNRFFIVVMVIIALINFISVFTYKVQALSYEEMLQQSSQFLQEGKDKAGSVDTAAIAAEFVPLGQMLRMIGAGVLVAVTTYMGIKYLTSGPDAQAKLKQQLIGIVVSAVVLFGAYGIWSTVLKIAENFD